MIGKVFTVKDLKEELAFHRDDAPVFITFRKGARKHIIEKLKWWIEPLGVGHGIDNACCISILQFQDKYLEE